MRNTNIPENEHENVLDLFWQMLRTLDAHLKPEEDAVCALTVSASYDLMNRIGMTKARPRWETDDGPDVYLFSDFFPQLKVNTGFNLQGKIFKKTGEMTAEGGGFLWEFDKDTVSLIKTR